MAPNCQAQQASAWLQTHRPPLHDYLYLAQR